MHYRNVVVVVGPVFLLGCILRAAGFVPWPDDSGHTAPSIVCDDSVFDFGRHQIGTTIEHTFIVRNNGKNAAEIRTIRPDCSCAVAEFSKNLIGPGQSLALEIKLSLKGIHGPQEKNILVASNDPVRPYLILKIKGFVTSDMSIKPAVVDFGTVLPGAKVIKTLALEAEDSTVNFWITKIESDSKELEIRHEAVKVGRAYRLLVTYKGSSKQRRFQARLIIRTDHKKSRRSSFQWSRTWLGFPSFGHREL